MKNSKGFTPVELGVYIVIAFIIASGFFNVVLNNRGATEARAYEASRSFVAQNDIEVKRLTCAGDSDGDGYGSCLVVSTNGEKVSLSCPTGFIETNLFGATSCKEISYVNQLELR